MHTLAQTTKMAWYGGLASLMVRRFGQNASKPDTRQPKNVPLYKLIGHIRSLNAMDRANIADGVYPILGRIRPPNFVKSYRQARTLFADAEVVNIRRQAKKGTEIRADGLRNTDIYPAYYQQNFHFQTDGWLSDASAELYESQVETLFLGTADTMRRIALGELCRCLSDMDRSPKRILDIGCGNGKIMGWIHQIWPQHFLTGLDLSPNYLSAASKALGKSRKFDLVHGKAEEMPFEDAQFDLVYANYLFHELPPKIRKAALAEAFRTLRPGGCFVFSDSLQLGDTEELDPLLKYFPTRFHEPFYNSYLETDFDTLLQQQGFTKQGRKKLAFLTKILVYKKPI